jgi:hypothetical protein
VVGFAAKDLTCALLFQDLRNHLLLLMRGQNIPQTLPPCLLTFGPFPQTSNCCADRRHRLRVQRNRATPEAQTTQTLHCNDAAQALQRNAIFHCWTPVYLPVTRVRGEMLHCMGAPVRQKKCERTPNPCNATQNCAFEMCPGPKQRPKHEPPVPPTSQGFTNHRQIYPFIVWFMKVQAMSH